MCGIVGFYSNGQEPTLTADLSAAIQLLSHRGPDDSGLYFDKNLGVGLGHRRLSIIDLSPAGHQPMVSDDGSNVIVFNGEIYNYLEIKKELTRYGHRFKGASDTEVVLTAYGQWGVDCLEKFMGMFAFAIWDRSHRRLFIARDRMGIKPLYFSHSKKNFFFGSELKALMAFHAFERQVDPEAFRLYLHYQYIPAPRTIFKNTYKLEPGHYILFDGVGVMKRRWWELPGSRRDHYVPEPIAEKEALLQLNALLTQAVSDRLVSDVPLGALLSGGVDSSMVVAIMQKVSRSPVKTFSIGFGARAYNEAPWASQVAAHLKTDHTELYVTSQDALNTILRLPEIYDEPFADSSSVPTFLVSRLTRDQVTVALSGDGGDEQFAGYVRYWMTETMARYMAMFPRRAREQLRSNLGKIPIKQLSPLYQAIRNYLPQRLNVENFPDKWQKLVNQLGHSDLSELYRMTVSIWSQDEIRRLTGGRVATSTYEQAFSESADLEPIQKLMVVDQQTYLPDAMLTKVDRASMAAGLEVRVPLLDHRVVEFTSRLPVSFKVRNGKGKYLLRQLLRQYVPRQLIERPKMGFGIPIAEWFRHELKEPLNDYLSPDRLKKEGRLDHHIVHQTLQAHQKGTVNHQHRLWALLMWEMWREKWIS